MRAKNGTAGGSRSNGTHPRVSRTYDARFRPTAAYRTSLPDIVDAANGGIKGSHVPIQQVGVSNFKLPLKFRTKKGKVLTLETSVTGTVSLEAELKGINMSRIVRSFYDHKDDVFTGERGGGDTQVVPAQHKEQGCEAQARLLLSDTPEEPEERT